MNRNLLPLATRRAMAKADQIEFTLLHEALMADTIVESDEMILSLSPILVPQRLRAPFASILPYIAGLQALWELQKYEEKPLPELDSTPSYNELYSLAEWHFDLDSDDSQLLRSLIQNTISEMRYRQHFINIPREFMKVFAKLMDAVAERIAMVPDDSPETKLGLINLYRVLNDLPAPPDGFIELGIDTMPHIDLVISSAEISLGTKRRNLTFYNGLALCFGWDNGVALSNNAVEALFDFLIPETINGILKCDLSISDDLEQKHRINIPSIDDRSDK
ncbi:MAG: hypothetical protein HWE12_12925 [Oceanospirillaceae bacterium]|nr:hypothetical protein [Oceanospirillaceae bacterium]